MNCPNKNFDGGTVIFFECHFEFFLNKGKECYVTNQELIQKLRCEKGCKPVSYTHLDVYKRQAQE